MRHQRTHTIRAAVRTAVHVAVACHAVHQKRKTGAKYIAVDAVVVGADTGSHAYYACALAVEAVADMVVHVAVFKDHPRRCQI